MKIVFFNAITDFSFFRVRFVVVSDVKNFQILGLYSKNLIFRPMNQTLQVFTFFRSKRALPYLS